MKTGKLSRDEFAIEIFKLGSELKNYNFDVFYDIQRIMDIDKQKRVVTSHPQKDKIHYFTRELGTHIIVSAEKEDINLYNQHNEHYYILDFFWNCDYFAIDSPYVIITKIK